MGWCCGLTDCPPPLGEGHKCGQVGVGNQGPGSWDPPEKISSRERAGAMYMRKAKGLGGSDGDHFRCAPQACWKNTRCMHSSMYVRCSAAAGCCDTPSILHGDLCAAHVSLEHLGVTKNISMLANIQCAH
jgi:hypothetical protein